MKALLEIGTYLLLLHLVFTGATSPGNGELTMEEFKARRSTYKASQAPTKKPPNTHQGPLLIHLLGESNIHGFLGDAVVPAYHNMTSGGRSTSNKWRIVCQRESQVFVLVMNVEIEDREVQGEGAREEYLQVRRRKIRGTNNKFHAYNFKLNSILIAHVNAQSVPSDCYPFRISYFCIRTLETDSEYGIDRTAEAERLLLNDDILSYIETHPKALDDLDWLFQTKDYQNNFQNPGNHTTITDMRNIWIYSLLNI